MRTFSELARELIGLAGVGIRGVASGDWTAVPELEYRDRDGRPGPATKGELLMLWDRVTKDIDSIWPSIPSTRFMEIDPAFGEYEAPVWSHLFYWIDNEVHHRGQGYVYLRALGLEPPQFWHR